jgi:hypothetical protein
MLAVEAVARHLVEHEPELRVAAVGLFRVRVEIDGARIRRDLDVDVLVERFGIDERGFQKQIAETAVDLVRDRGAVRDHCRRDVLGAVDQRLHAFGGFRRRLTAGGADPDRRLVLHRLVDHEAVMRLRDVDGQARFALLLAVGIDFIRPLPLVAIVGVGKLGVFEAARIGLVVPELAALEPLARAVDDPLVAGQGRIVVGAVSRICHQTLIQPVPLRSGGISGSDRGFGSAFFTLRVMAGNSSVRAHTKASTRSGEASPTRPFGPKFTISSSSEANVPTWLMRPCS